MLDSFKLFFKQTAEKSLNWTNTEGWLICETKRIAIDQDKFKTFLVVIIFIGVYKSNNQSAFQLCSKEDGRPILDKLMSLNFMIVNFMMRIYEKKDRSPDKLQPFRSILEEWNSNFWLYSKTQYDC